MRVLGYARVSTENQVKSGSLEEQKNQIRRFCELQGHELLEILCDAGLSALSDRPAWNRAMQWAREKKIEAIVVTKLDRWGRSVKDLVTSIDELRRLGVHFISIGDNLDTSTPNGRLLFHILSAFAEFEREIIRERMQAGRERAKAQGKACHRPRKKLDEREIRRLYELGLSARSIGKIMGVSHNTVLSRLREIGVKIR
ncbi:MAG: recombinase family protein [Thermosphaera sp.]